MELKEKLNLRKILRNLESIRGRHTELVSVYIPKGYDIVKIIQHLQQEQSTASNIKDARTRNNVIDSLEKMIRHLRLFKRTPENGLAVFAGNSSKSENKIDINVWSIEPPEPLNIRLYRCDQTFLLDPLKDMMEHKETYGLIILDRREANLGLLKGTSIKLLTTLTSDVPGKTRAGGQCLSFDTCVTLSDEQEVPIADLEKGDEVRSYDFNAKEFIVSKVTDIWKVKKDKVYQIKINDIDDSIIEASEDHVFFLENGNTKAAKDLVPEDILINNHGRGVHIKDITAIAKETELIDISVEAKNFLANNIVVHNSAQRFARIREGAAKEFYKRIGFAANKAFLEMKNLKGILLGGPGGTKEDFVNEGHLNNQLKEKLLGIQDLSYTGEFGLRELVDKSKEILAKDEIMKEKEAMEKFFSLLNKNPEMVAYSKQDVLKALEAGAVETMLVSESLDDQEIEGLEEKADMFGSKMQLISTETTEGNQLKSMGGIAAILRYAYK